MRRAERNRIAPHRGGIERLPRRTLGVRVDEELGRREGRVLEGDVRGDERVRALDGWGGRRLNHRVRAHALVQQPDQTVPHVISDMSVIIVYT